MSPYQVFFNYLPNYDQLHVFGSLCYAILIPQSGDKFVARSIKVVLLGYPFAKKGYRVLDLTTRQVFISRDVMYVGIVFHFKDIPVESPQLLFPPLSAYVEDDPLSESYLTIDNDVSDMHSSSLSSEPTAYSPAIEPMQFIS